MGFIGVDGEVLVLAQKISQTAGGQESGQMGSDLVHGESLGAGALGERGAGRGQQFGLVSPGTQAVQKDVALVLATAPLRIKIDEQGSHG